jgi:hypothetical protein
MADTHSYLSQSTRDILRRYLGDVGVDIANELIKVNGELPPVISTLGEAHSLKVQDPDNQISWGITRRDGDQRYAVAILVEQHNSRAARIAEDITRACPDHVVARTISRAHSSLRDITPNPRRGDLNPGSSIGHIAGFPGTIGCVVWSEEGNWPGLISASHVLSMNNRAGRGDHVIVPGHPDGPKTSEARCGTLANFSYLIDFEEVDPNTNYLNCVDAALVRVDQRRECRHSVPDATYVPDPKDPDRKMLIKEVLGGDAVAERLGTQVFKVGRTTGLTAGRLDLVGLQRQLINIHDKVYVYTNVLAVEATQGQPFSQAGDSGALVYTADGYGIGLIIGGNDQISYLSPLDACLRDMKTRLLTT